MRNFKAWFVHIILFVFLTVVTQIGGLVLLVSNALSFKIRKSYRFKKTIVFLAIYLFSTLIVVPLIAPMFGREKVIHDENISPTTYATVLLNRNYVIPELNDLLQAAAIQLSSDGIALKYLDANFPFVNGFPLIPHLSHSDGKKIDISFVYSDRGTSVDSKKKKSLSGYGVFEGPKGIEIDQISECIQRGYWQYDYPKYFTFGSINKDLEFSNRLNFRLIQSFLKQDKLGKIFLEPHLKNRLGLKHKKIRYHGCQSVRHDDHIHIQL